jgi:hypothetical protein
MKKIVIVLFLSLVYAAPALACDCDTASAIQQGYQDRLHRPFVDYNQPSQEKAKKPEVKTQQQTNPGQQAAPQQGGLKEEVK